jgi:hypothetical protein
MSVRGYINGIFWLLREKIKTALYKNIPLLLKIIRKHEKLSQSGLFIPMREKSLHTEI